MFRLTLRISLAYSLKTGETYAATRSAGRYEPFGGSLVVGLAPVELAFTVTPARASASMSAVRANAAGSSTWNVWTTGSAPSGTEPARVITLGAPGVVVAPRLMADPAGPVVTVLVTV